MNNNIKLTAACLIVFMTVRIIRACKVSVAAATDDGGCDCGCDCGCGCSDCTCGGYGNCNTYVSSNYGDGCGCCGDCGGLQAGLGAMGAIGGIGRIFG